MEPETKETEKQTHPDRRILTRNIFTARLILQLLLIATVAGGGAWFLVSKHATSPTPNTIPPPALPVAPPATNPATLPPEKTACQEIDEQIAQFFSSLDNKDIVAARHFKDGSHAHFARLIDTVLAHPPVVVDENKQLTSILHNTAHFYRILGKRDLLLIRDLLNREEGNTEAAMALFYRWSEQMPQCGEAACQIRFPLTGLYEYACFFLNTLGGQAYVFRRDPKIRLLVRYYSILIIDRANDASLNRYGLDIRPAAASVLQELRSVSGLAGQEDYTARILAIQDKYPATDHTAFPSTAVK